MAEDLVALYCKGEGGRFRGVVCKHYDAKECRLLKGRPMKVIFDKGRCEPYRMLKAAVEQNLYRYNDRIDPEDHTEPTTFLICKRIRQNRLKFPKLPVLMAYLKKAAYTGVIEILIEEGVLWKNICGNCIYLSVSKPHICQREHIIMDGERIENPHHGETRNPSSRACKEGFEPHVFEDVLEIPVPPEPEPSGIIEEMKDALIKRIERETNKNVRRKYERQYVAFCRFAMLIQEGYSESEALKKIAEALRVSLRTVERDMAEIREFFKAEMSYNAQ